MRTLTKSQAIAAAVTAGLLVVGVAAAIDRANDRDSRVENVSSSFSTSTSDVTHPTQVTASPPTTPTTIGASFPTTTTPTSAAKGVVHGRTWANDTQRSSTVTLMKADRVVTKTTADAQGNYMLKDVPPGRYELWADATGRPEALTCSTTTTAGDPQTCLIPPANSERRAVEVRAGERHRVDFV